MFLIQHSIPLHINVKCHVSNALKMKGKMMDDVAASQVSQTFPTLHCSYSLTDLPLLQLITQTQITTAPHIHRSG